MRPLFFCRRFFASEATFKTYPYRLHRLTEPPAAEVTLTHDEALTYYTHMVTIRRMEHTASNLYQSKIIRGFCHLYAGQEAIAIGVFSNIRAHDTLIASYRNHPWAYLVNNYDVVPVLGELVGVTCGSERGKGGSMHLYGRNFYGGNGIVGAQVPMGVGIALAHKYRNSDAVSVVLYGDGASNNGQVYEAYNLAKLWELPALLICENNQYSMGTSVSRSTPNPDIFVKGDLIPGIWVNGMDVLTVREATRYAFSHILAGKGPILLEMNTYRYYGHSMSDPGTSYRSREEIEEIRQKKDPIVSFKKQILEAGIVSDDELKKIEDAAKKKVEDAVEVVKKDKEVGLEELTYDIYANDKLITEVRGVLPFKMLKHKAAGRAYNLK